MSFYSSAPPAPLDIESAVVEAQEVATPVSTRPPSVVVSASPVRGALPAGAQLVRVDSFLLRNMQTFDFERGAWDCRASCVHLEPKTG